MPPFYQPSREQIVAAVETLLPRYHELLAELIGFDSVYGSEGPMQRRVAAEMERLGLNLARIKSRTDADALNLAARLTGADGSRHLSLVLNAHADVVPVDVPDRWRYPPFSAQVEGREIHGRGAQDDKAGVATILLVVETLRSLGVALPGDLIVQVVIEEETTGNGTRALLAEGYGGDGVVICDGTWPERLICSHLGQISFRLRFTGDPMAAANERRAVNPILTAMEMIGRLRDLAAERNAAIPVFEGIESPCFANVGAFHSGVWFGSVPAEAVVDMQIGFAPPDTVTSMMAAVRDLAARSAGRISLEPSLLAREPYVGDRNAPLVARLRELVGRHAEGQVQLVAVSGYADMGLFGIPDVVLYGPGGGRNAHGVDEHYLLDHMAGIATNLVAFAVDWCSQPRPVI